MRYPSSVVLVAAAMLLPATLPAQQTITGQALRRLESAAARRPPQDYSRRPSRAQARRGRQQHAARHPPPWPIAPDGFKVTLYAGGDSTPMQRADNKEKMAPVAGTFLMPRLIRTAPNGDLFLADSGAGTIFILRGVGPDGKAAQIEKFATGLDHPFGIAFYPADNPKYVYVGNATTVQRIPYHSGELHATAAPETVVPDIPGYAQLTGGGHWTRDVVFTEDGRHMLVSVGSGSNLEDPD